jgi:hypothetical protein
MSEKQFSEERLREALASVAETAGDGVDCPDPNRLWLSGRDELDPDENEHVVMHLAHCTNCGTAWRIARDLAPDAAAVHTKTPSWFLRGGWTRLAAAAVLVIAVGGAYYILSPRVGEQESAYRTQDSESLQSTVDETVPLPRNDFFLRWTAGPEGTIYDVIVSSETVEILARGLELDEPEYRVPAEALEAVASGSRVFWQVNARLPDGRHMESDAFIVLVE